MPSERYLGVSRQVALQAGLQAMAARKLLYSRTRLEYFRQADVPS